ncbi:two-component transcriptional response regulator, LuxR family NIT01rdhP [Dehalococcoides mccartyi]|nr:two-component transcriptional response regulator, LuxR family NIT01rdhP [Dehalococcoides mccartyi]
MAVDKIIMKPNKSSPKIGHCTSPVRIFLADDHQVAREGLRKVLCSEADIEIVGEADNASDVLRLVEELKPQVVLTDIKISGLDSCELSHKLKGVYPPVKVVFLTGYEAEPYVTEALYNGINGFLTKDCPLELLSNAIRVVACGGSVWQGDLLESASKNFVKFVNAKAEGRSPAGEYSSATINVIPQDVLSPRELEILIMVARGYTNKEISVNLDYAEITIKKYVKGIMTKLNVSNRTLAGIAAAKFGLV